MTDVNAREAQLKERLEELTGRLERIEEHLDEPPNPDWEEEAQEAEMDEVLEGLGEAGVREVQGIRAALARIKAGTYGVCTKCGEEISEERLDVLPHSPFCRECARELAEAKQRE